MNNELQQAKDKAAQEAGYENFAEYQCEIFSTSEVLNRAMEIYASQQRTEGIREGFEAAREGCGFWEVEFEYNTVEDYLNKSK